MIFETEPLSFPEGHNVLVKCEHKNSSIWVTAPTFEELFSQVLELQGTECTLRSAFVWETLEIKEEEDSSIDEYYAATGDTLEQFVKSLNQGLSDGYKLAYDPLAGTILTKHGFQALLVKTKE